MGLGVGDEGENREVGDLLMEGISLVGEMGGVWS